MWLGFVLKTVLSGGVFPPRLEASRASTVSEVTACLSVTLDIWHLGLSALFVVSKISECGKMMDCILQVFDVWFRKQSPSIGSHCRDLSLLCLSEYALSLVMPCCLWLQDLWVGPVMPGHKLQESGADCNLLERR